MCEDNPKPARTFPQSWVHQDGQPKFDPTRRCPNGFAMSRARQLGISRRSKDDLVFNDLCAICVLPDSEPAINFCAIPPLSKDDGWCGRCGEGICMAHLTQHPWHGLRCIECNNCECATIISNVSDRLVPSTSGHYIHKDGSSGDWRKSPTCKCSWCEGPRYLQRDT
jgi:hypothetical protein